MKQLSPELAKKAADFALKLHLDAVEKGIVFRVGFAQLWEIVYEPMGVDPKVGRDLLADVYLSGCRHAFEVVLALTNDEPSEEVVISRLEKMNKELEQFNAIFAKKYDEAMKKGTAQLMEKLKSHSQKKADEPQD